MEREGKKWRGTAFSDGPARIKRVWLRHNFSRPIYYIVPGLLLGFLLLLEI